MDYKTLGFQITVLVAGSLLLVLSAGPQTPNAAASGQMKTDQGFYPGWNLGTRFEGSTSNDGSVYDLGFGLGYNFTRHFGVGIGAPFYFIGTPSSIKA